MLFRSHDDPQSYLKKQETSQINNLTLHLKQSEKEEQKNPKASRRKEIIKIIQTENKETQVLNDTIDQIDLIDIYRTCHPKTADYTFFSSAHGTFSRIDHILGHKSSLGKFKKIEIMSSIFSDHSTIRLDINCRKKSVKIPTHGA